jgi:hypothetical protein
VTETTWPEQEEMRRQLRAQARKVTSSGQQRGGPELKKLQTLAKRANHTDNPHRLGVAAIGQEVGRSHRTVYEWVNNMTTRAARRGLGTANDDRPQCEATAAHTGLRCKQKVRPGRDTCWAHRTWDPPLSA